MCSVFGDTSNTATSPSCSELDNASVKDAEHHPMKATTKRCNTREKRSLRYLLGARSPGSAKHNCRAESVDERMPGTTRRNRRNAPLRADLSEGHITPEFILASWETTTRAHPQDTKLVKTHTNSRHHPISKRCFFVPRTADASGGVSRLRLRAIRSFFPSDNRTFPLSSPPLTVPMRRGRFRCRCGA